MKKIMKNLKKIPTLLMLVLSVVMSVPNVFAIANDSTGNATTVDEENAAITIAGIEKEFDKHNVTISVYHIIDANIDETVTGGQPKTPVYTWDEAVAEWVRTNYSKYVDEENSIKDSNGRITNYAVSAEFTPCENENETATDRKCLNAKDAKDFYDALANAIKSENGALKGLATEKVFAKAADSEKGYTAWTEENSKTKISGLTMGNKLILIENGMNVYKPSAINIVPEYNKTSKAWEVKDTDLTVKYTTPSIDKTVEEVNFENGKVGDTVNFKLKVAIPTYPDNATAKTIKISDLFDKGLTLDKTSIKVLANTTDDFANATELTKDTNYTLTTTATNDYTFLVTIDNDQYDTVKTYKYVYVTYKGTINGDAIVTECTTETVDGKEVKTCPGNSNTAKLEYNNNPYDNNSWEDGTTDKVTVYTYGIKLDKIDEDLDNDGNKVFLPGAKFSISTTEGGDPIAFVKVKDGVYRRAITAAEAALNADVTADTNTVTVLEVSSEDAEQGKGKLEVIGLYTGTYYVTEVEAPKGYVKLQKAIPVTITDADKNGLVEVKNKEQDNGYVSEEVKNSDDMPVLPVTGGIGTLLFSVIGILFMGLGAFLIKNILKKEDVQ